MKHPVGRNACNSNDNDVPPQAACHEMFTWNVHMECSKTECHMLAHSVEK